MLEIRAFLRYRTDLFLCSLSAWLLLCKRPSTYLAEDFLALKLVQLRRRLLEIEARLVTRTGHVCVAWCCWQSCVQKSWLVQKTIRLELLPHIAPWPAERGPWPYVPPSGDCHVGQSTTHSPRSFASFLVSNAGGLLSALSTAATWSKTRTATPSQRYADANLALPRPPHTHTMQFNGKWISYSHTAMAYSMSSVSAHVCSMLK
jgi:hypothetical protein